MAGESIQLICHVTKGDQPLKISWSIQGEEFDSQPGISTTKIGDSTSLLTIASTMAAHSSNYTCTATNPAGSTSYTATVHINGIALLYFYVGLDIFIITNNGHIISHFTPRDSVNNKYYNSFGIT